MLEEANIIFNFEGIDVTIQCSKNEKMKDICQKYVKRIDKNINSFIFLYGGNQLNFNSNFNQQANKLDKERNIMEILVYKNDANEYVCPKCGEKIKLNTEKIDDIILSLNNTKDTINSCKLNIDNIIKISSDNLINSQLKKVNLVLNTLNEDITKINDKLRHKQSISKGDRVEWKGALIPLFSGLLIGFFTSAFYQDFYFPISPILLKFHGQFFSSPLSMKTFKCFRQLMLYLLYSALMSLPIRFLTNIPTFLYRKILHVISFSCFSLMMLNTDDWRAAALTSLILAAVYYPMLYRLEKKSWYKMFFAEKSEGEAKRSMLKLFLMFSAVITVAWGIFKKPLAANSAILMWGFGDATAAIVGIPFGRHKIHLPSVNPTKSWEGSFSMLSVSFVVGLSFLHFSGGFPTERAISASLLMSSAGSITEMFSSSEWDTFTVPCVILLLGIFLM